MTRPVLTAAAAAQLDNDDAPLPALLSTLLDWFESGHLARLHAEGFDDLRRAHNNVFIHLPAEGARVTDLAERAGMTKQAMGELVADLVAKGYLGTGPDPDDGRAKRITWADRGLASHEATMAAFREIESELDAVVLGGVEALRGQLMAAVRGLAGDS